MKVTLQYMPDCPNWQAALDNVNEALRLADHVEQEVQLVAVTTWQEAEAIGFRGSPTILINGHDPFADESTGVGLTCRVFATPEGFAVAPTIDQLVDAFIAEEAG